MIGSGWLLAPYTAAKAAGPAAFLSWTIASVATLLVSLAFIDLAFRHPMSGGNVRWPQLASGPLVGTVVGWAVFLQAVYAAPSESSAVVQYASGWLPWVMSGESLSWAGRLLAVGLLAVFCTLNLFGLRLLAAVNNVVAAVKVVIPALTVILLLASGFDSSNVDRGGGVAPFGVSAALTAVVGGGLVYSFTGINAAAVMSGEAKNPRRTVPRATLIVLVGSVLLYLGLQAVMIFSTPAGLLGSGWHGINLKSPLAAIATLLGLGWFSTVLLADAVFSPSGSLLIGIGVKGRYTYGAAQNGLLPAALTRVDRRFGIPRRALLLNVSIGSVIVLAFGNWKTIASSLSFYYGLSYAAVSVAVTVLGASTPVEKGWLRRWTTPVGFASFVISGLILYWSAWEKIRIAVPLLLIGFGIYLVRSRARAGSWSRIQAAGGWLVGFLVMLVALSGLGSFGGTGLLAAPYDSVVVGVLSGGIWWLAHRSGLRHQHRLQQSTVDLPDNETDNARSTA
ncbi:amino acid permease [Amycolatopsis taiwanensis]|uniref:Amino acid permease n=1 Tax=Amycolatopsis taiwanensis TaxID=342230 RepID=A0A9W6QZI7_9PSEU|nr:amino acid permease [Amycolatopsis taiwanensis]